MHGTLTCTLNETQRAQAMHRSQTCTRRQTTVCSENELVTIGATLSGDRLSSVLLHDQRLCAETVEGSALAFEGVDDVERGDGLALGVFGVGDRVTDDVLEEDLQSALSMHVPRGGSSQTHLEDTPGLFVDQTRDTLDTTTTGETSDRGLCNTPTRSARAKRLGHSRDSLDVVPQDLSVPLRTTLAETFATFAATRHCVC